MRVRWPFLWRFDHDAQVASLTERLLAFNATNSHLEAERDYWRSRAERLMDSALAKAGHAVVMVEPEPRDVAGFGPLSGMSISEIEDKKPN